jgi:pSer/pThr/pTyr-binding forkhead associated (FHA) protein
MDASVSRKTKSPPGGVPDGETMVSSERDPAERSSAPPRRGPGPRSPRLGDTKLVVEQGRILGEQFLLAERDTVIGRYDGASGRCPDIDLTAQDPAYVHRQHVRLVFNRAGDQLLIHDLGGRNGAYLNNQLIESNASAVVQLGDKIRIGRVVLRVQNVRDQEDDRDA